MQSLRQTEILDLARRDGQVQVEDLAARFQVTLQTIRRDLTDLAEAGRLERVHGGAVLPSGLSNIVYSERRALNQAAKTAIGRAAAACIPEDCAVCLNIGTTTEAVAQSLLTHQHLLVVTNNVNVAQILGNNPTCEIVLTGGTYRRTDGGLSGTQAVDTIRGFKFDHAIIGCSAIDADGDLLDFDRDEVETSRAILAASRHTTLVVDCSKLTRTAPARIASLGTLDRVITDKKLPAPLAALCAASGTEVILAPYSVRS